MSSLARLFALLGGAVLTLLILIVCASILGRSLNSILHSDALQSFMPGIASALLATGVGPINGDFELVEAGMAFTIFAFLPLCHLHGAHASVDIFTNSLSNGAQRYLRAATEVLFAVVLIIVAWQLFQGTLSKQRSGTTTFLLGYPLWWSYAVSVLAAVMAAIMAIYVACMRSLEAFSGQSIMPADAGADH